MVPRMRTGGGCCAQASVATRTDIAASAPVSARGTHKLDFGMALSLRCFLAEVLRRQPLGNPAERAVFRWAHHSGRCVRYRPHIGGVRPSLPTLMRSVSKEPSGRGLTKAMILAPALSSDLSAGT